MTPLYGLQRDLLFLEPRLSSITQPIINSSLKKVLASNLFDKELFAPRVEKITEKLFEMLGKDGDTSPIELEKLQAAWSQFSHEFLTSLDEDRPTLESLKARATVIASLIASIHNQAYKQQDIAPQVMQPVRESEPTPEELVSDATLLHEAHSFDFAYPVTTHTSASLILKIISNAYGEKFLNALTESHSAIFAQEAFVQLLLIDCIRSNTPLHSVEWFHDISQEDCLKLEKAIKSLTHEEITSLVFDDLSSQKNIKTYLTKIIANCRIANFSFRTLLTILKPLFSLTENLTVQTALKEKDHNKACKLIKTNEDRLVQSWCLGEISQRLVRSDRETALTILKKIPDKKRKTLRSVSIMQEISHAEGKEKAKEWLETVPHNARETFILSLVEFKLQKEEDASDDDALSLLLMLPKPHSKKTDKAIYNFAHSLAERDLEKAKVAASTIQNKYLLVSWFYEMAQFELNNTDQTITEIIENFLNTLKILYDEKICSYKPEVLIEEILNQVYQS